MTAWSVGCLRVMQLVASRKKCVTAMVYLFIVVSSVVTVTFVITQTRPQGGWFNSTFAGTQRWSHFQQWSQVKDYFRYNFSSMRKLPEITHNKTMPRRNQIVFMKIHKAASSTVQNILLRFALEHKLNVLFSKTGLHLNEDGSKILNNSIVEHPQGMKFDILCNHLIFNFSEISPYFPPSTMYVGIVREPFQLFTSAFRYYYTVWHDPYLKKVVVSNPKNPIHEYLKNPKFFEPSNPRKSRINNRMSVDFGFPVEHFEESKNDSKKIETFINYLNRTFHLVLVADMFDESMVLLRRVMNWDIKDVLYLKNNVFSSSWSWRYNTKYTHEDFNRFKKWAAIDYALYNHFLELFKSKIRSEPRFEDELKAFRKIIIDVAEFCRNNSNTESESTLLIDSNEWTEKIYIQPQLCQQMIQEEDTFVSFVRDKQRQRMLLKERK